LHALLEEFLAAERERLRRGLSRLILLLCVVGSALVVLIAAVVFALMGAYQTLLGTMAPWQAGLWIASSLLVLGIVLLLLARLSGRSRRRPAPPPVEAAGAAGAAPAGAAAERAGAAAGEFTRRAAQWASHSPVSRLDLTLGALVAGFALGKIRSARRRNG
jgi:hypothetical protein